VSHIDELIAELCPNGVEFKTLGEVLRIRNGKDHKGLGDGEVPVYGSGGIMRYADTAAADGPSVLIPRKGSLGNIFYVEGPFWVVDTIFRTEINSSLAEPKFIYYLLLTMGLGAMNQAGGVPSQTQSVLNLLRIPVPPLEVQREIVRILEKFTQLEAELEAELEARRRQYEHYRHSALGKHRYADNDWVPLASIAEIRTGTKPDYTSDMGAFPYINAGNEPSGFTSRANSRGNTITIPSRGQGGAGHVGYQKDDFWSGPLCYRVESKSKDLLTRFLYFYLRNIQDELVALRKVGSIPAVNKSDLGTVLVPVVPLEEQQRVVETLDRLDALVNDLSIGLPAELVARRKQYEYYRDKLLAFKEVN
jgi:type I restriction enzyme S subunit